MTKRIPLTLWKKPIKSCSCITCQGKCEVPCWPTPEEAEKLIRLGYGNRLMLVSRDLNDKEIFVICPARNGNETKYSNRYDTICNFQEKKWTVFFTQYL